MGAWVLKFLSGFAFWKAEQFGKLLYYVIIVSACIGVYWAIFLKPSTTTHQTAQTIQNITTPEHKDFMFLGIKLWKIKLGASVE